MPDLPAGTVTFLFSDIEGSTQLLRRLGSDAAYARALAESQAILRAIWAAHGGVEVDTSGDGFFVAFSSAPQALAAAAEATRALAAHDWPESEALRVRIGLHTGAPQVAGDRYVGMDVHRAARIAAAGHGGQVLLSDATEGLARDRPPEGVTLRDLGPHQLKDMQRPERIYQLVIAGLPSDFPPLKSLDTRPHELPPRALGYIGHADDVQTLCAALRPGPASVACAAVVGMGGLGKSSLAAEVVHTLASPPTAYPGGVAWVRCDERVGVEGLTWILDQLLAGWGAEVAAEVAARVATNPEEALALRERALRVRLLPDGAGEPAAALVLLDNVEPGLPIARLLDSLAPLGMVTLLTSRAELSSPRVRLARLDALDAAAGAELFAERFAARGGVWNAARDLPMAQAITEALGGLPLAIELAAARAARTRLSLSALAGELHGQDALGRLADPLGPSASVQYSLSKTLAALAPRLRVRFAALGLPEGPDWPTPVIERLLTAAPGQAPAPPESATARADLEALVAYSLVGLVSGEGDMAPRVRLHPLVRELAREEWARLPVETQTLALDGLMRGVDAWVGEHRVDTAALVQDTDLIAGAIRRAYAERVALPVVISTVAACDFAYVRSFALDLELRRIRLECARLLGDPVGEIEALARLSVLLSNVEQQDEERRYLNEALALARTAGSPQALADVLALFAGYAIDGGSTEESRTYYAEARTMFDTLGEGQFSIRVVNNLGRAAGALGYLNEGILLSEKALARFRAEGDTVGESVALNNIADISMLKGDYDTARMRTQEGLAIFRAIGDILGVGIALDRLGELAMTTGDLGTAAGFFEQALSEVATATGDPLLLPVRVHVRGNLAVLRGEIAGAGGDAQGAEVAYREAVTIFGSSKHPAWHLQPHYVEFTRSRLAATHPDATPDVAHSASEPSSPPATSATPPSRAKRRWWPWGASKGGGRATDASAARPGRAGTGRWTGTRSGWLAREDVVDMPVLGRADGRAAVRVFLRQLDRFEVAQ
ncbi:MAG TPA: adenylate/guanylate cyclase domain-containing protein [Ktedonobacterales bacterium]